MREYASYSMETPDSRKIYGLGIAIGMPLGIPIGIVLGNFALGPAIGAAIGIAIGFVLERIEHLSEESKRDLERVFTVSSIVGILVFTAVAARHLVW